jgi:hypothetical protein
MTTSDFPVLFADILDRQLLADYQQVIPQWRSYARAGTVRDFRTVKRFAVDGGKGLLTDVPEKTEYPEDSLPDVTPFTYAVTKKGKRFQLSWETIDQRRPRRHDAAARTTSRSRRATARSSSRPAVRHVVRPELDVLLLRQREPAHRQPGAVVTGPAGRVHALAAQKDSNGNPILVDAPC